MGRTALVIVFALGAVVVPVVVSAQQPCVPGTTICVQGDGRGGVRAGGSAQVGPNGASATGTTNANGNANGNANAQGEGGGGGGGGGHHGWHRYRGRFATGVTLCPTLKAGVTSGTKVGGCVAVSFRWDGFAFEMETDLLFGGTRHSTDWVFPMSFLIPLGSQESLFEGLQLRVGGSPFGVTWAKTEDGGSYFRFGLHAGLTYEMLLGSSVAWRVLDARAFLDFGTKREVDRLGDFLDFGGQLSTGIVF